jgi:hypothetical protein
LIDDAKAIVTTFYGVFKTPEIIQVEIKSYFLSEISAYISPWTYPAGRRKEGPPRKALFETS